MFVRASLITVLICAMGMACADVARLEGDVRKWPADRCNDSESWLVFSGAELCVEMSSVNRIEHLNLSGPSLSLNAQLNGRPLEIGFFWFEKHAAVAGIHDHLGVAPEDVFRVLTGEIQHEDRHVVKEILFISEETSIQVYEGDGVTAYALIRSAEVHSEIYVFRPEKEGLIKLAGPFEGEDVDTLLSLIRW